MKHPQIFHRVSAHSPLTAVEQMVRFTDIVPRLTATERDDSSLLTWAEGCRTTGLPIRLGTSDSLLEANRWLSCELGSRTSPTTTKSSQVATTGAAGNNTSPIACCSSKRYCGKLRIDESAELAAPLAQQD